MNAPDELFATSEPFTTQNSEFKAGKGFSEEDLLSEPTPFPNQLLYCSSAGRTDQYFYKKYKECSIRMMAGDKRLAIVRYNWKLCSACFLIAGKSLEPQR